LKLGLHQSARMEQRLLQSPQMIQAMQILQLSAVDLEERIEQELSENPFLELREGSGEESAATGPGGEEGWSEGAEQALAQLEAMERTRAPRERARDTGEADRKLEALQNTPDTPRSMAAALLEELAMLDFTPRERAIAQQIVFALDARGYATQSHEELARECQVSGELGSQRSEPVTVEEVELVLKELRHATHPALGAGDLRESLLLQLGPKGAHPDLARRMVEEHLDDIVTNRLPRICRATGASMAEVNEALELIRSLDPSPAANYGEERAAAITPDVIVEEQDGRAEVRLNRESLTALTLSPTYRELLKQARRGDGAREWVKKRLESARWFLEAIAQRQSTLLKIAQVIFARQAGFLERGMAGLVPMRMQEVADEVGVHISTVSRAVSAKYAQTPRGTFPLKAFFTGGTQTEEGELTSQASIQQKLAALVAQEDPKNPLSDDQLADLLEQREHIKIARRTVTKYRKALSIPSSSQRRVY
jgi:RNA polymerase sigma-54 factor